MKGQLTALDVAPGHSKVRQAWTCVKNAHLAQMLVLQIAPLVVNAQWDFIKVIMDKPSVIFALKVHTAMKRAVQSVCLAQRVKKQENLEPKIAPSAFQEPIKKIKAEVCATNAVQDGTTLLMAKDGVINVQGIIFVRKQTIFPFLVLLVATALQALLQWNGALRLFSKLIKMMVVFPQ